MTALTAERSTYRRDHRLSSDPLAAGVKAYAGAIIVLDAAGNAKPAVTALNLTGRGICDESVDNSAGAAGDLSVRTRRSGWHKVNNQGDVTRANIGAVGYAVDDQTISSSSAGSTRSAVCTIRDVDSDGVWISFT